MNKKQIIISIISLLLLVLVACNADNNAGQDETMINNSGFDTISSESTTMPSNKYPHTKAIQIQEAKYKFVVEKGNGQAEYQLPRGITPSQRKEIQQDTTGQQPISTPEQEEAVPQQNTPQQVKEEPTTENAPATESTQGISEVEMKVIELTNAERRKSGLSELQADTSLSNVARTKSNDMQENDYFSHTSPTYGSPFDMIRDFGVSYNSAAENIAQGQRTPEQVVQSWMNSEGHRKNILNGDFTHIGVGYNSTGHHWTQMFISK